MSHQSNMRLFVVKIFLCLSGLFFGFAFLTETAFLQNPPPVATPSPTAPRRGATPRPKKTVAPTNNSPVETEIEDATISSNSAGGAATVASTPVPPANSTVRGKVFYADTGRAVKRAPIMLMRDKGFLGGGPGNTPTALTDGDGNFQMKNVQAGTYFAMINAPGVVTPMAFVDFSKMRGGSSNEAEEFEKASEGFEKIFVDGITDAEVQIPARRGGAIGGRVMYDNGDPAIGVKVEILRKVKDKFMPVIPNFGSFFAMFLGAGVFQTDDRGIYRFSGLPAGEYIVKITENTSHSENNERRGGYGSEMEALFGGSANSLLSIFYQDAFDSKSANVIGVEPGQEITEINLTIPSRSLHTVEGRIVSRKDKSPVKARISLKREGEEEVYSIFSEISRERSSATDEKGNWKFKELPKGTYKLMIEPIQESESDKLEYIGDIYGANSNVTMTNPQKSSAPPKPKLAGKVHLIQVEDRDIPEMVIELGSGATIDGIVTVENNGEMPKNLSISTVHENGEFTSSDTVGSVYLGEARNAPAKKDNDFRIENIAEGKTYFYVHVDEDYYVKSARAGGVDLLAGALDLKDGETILNVQIILSKESATLKGKILDEKNDPVKNAEFLLVPTDAAKQKNSSFFRGVKSNERGEFERKIPPGEYAVIFVDSGVSLRKFEEFSKWLTEAVKDAQKVSLDAGETENLTVKKIKK